MMIIIQSISNHPYQPFISKTIWYRLFAKKKKIMTKTFVKNWLCYFHFPEQTTSRSIHSNFEILNGNIGRVRYHWIVLLKIFFLVFIVYSQKIKEMGILVVHHTVLYGIWKLFIFHSLLFSHSNSLVCEMKFSPCCFWKMPFDV